MLSPIRRTAPWAGIGALVALGIGFALWPRPVPVDLARVETGPMVEAVAGTGRTRIRHIFTLSAPVAGRALRIELEAGDPVEAGRTVIAHLQPADPAFLDLRTEAELRAQIRAAEAAVALSDAEIERAEADLAYVTRELARTRPLVEKGTQPRRRLDEVESTFRARAADLARARAARAMRLSELDRNRARLMSASSLQGRREDCDCLVLTAPIDGRILRIVHRSEGVVAAGAALVEIGDPADLDIVVDLLSQDAVRVAPGQEVIVEDWGGNRPLAGRVERVEPSGFTKISALGIEEQRVNVIVALEDGPDRRARLGHDFQVGVRIVQWRAATVTSVPLTALFRDGDQWQVFRVEDGRAVRRTVRRGRSDGVAVQILDGLEPGDAVIVHPNDRIHDGVAVTPRSANVQ